MESASSDSTFKTEINLSLKLRLSKTFNSTISRAKAIQKVWVFWFVWLLFWFFHSHVTDFVYELNTDMLLSERAQEITYLLLAKSGRRLLNMKIGKNFHFSKSSSKNFVIITLWLK